MTENLKTKLMLLFATVLAAAALVYGFSVIPNPAMQRELKLDHKRVTDLGELQYSIEDYYRSNNRLPESLTALTTNRYSSSVLTKVDPLTNQPYEYSVTSENSYQLCATFTTDSTKEIDPYDNENYSYSSFKAKFEHPSGRYCFQLQPPALQQYNLLPTQSPRVSTIPYVIISPTPTLTTAPKQ